MTQEKTKVQILPSVEFHRTLQELFQGKYDVIEDKPFKDVRSRCPHCSEWHYGKMGGVIFLFQCPSTRKEHPELLDVSLLYDGRTHD